MITNQNAQLESAKDSGEFARLYYQHQYDRLSKIEDQRLAITNIVMTLSAGALVLGFTGLDNLTIINGVGVPLMIIFSNLFAIAYILRSRDFMRVHKERARRVLEIYAKDMSNLNRSVSWSEKPFIKNRTFI